MNEEKQYQYQCNIIDTYEYNDTYDYDEQINYLVVLSEPEEPQWQNELHQLYGVENLLEQAEEFYYEENEDE